MNLSAIILSMSLFKSMNKNLATICKGFPPEMQKHVDDVFKKHVIQHDSYPIDTDAFYLEQNQKVQVPVRIYTGPYIDKSFSDAEKLIYDCIYSRSTDGHAREAAIKGLDSAKSIPFWAMPYLYISLSDYAIQVSSIIALDDEIVADLRKLSRLNPEQYRLLEARATSYWNAYYREKFRKEEYPALEIINKIKG